jgi:glutaminyl-peptide cyclotransferase
MENWFHWRHALVGALFILPILSCDKHGPVPAFDGDRAYQDLVHQVDFGPRVPGTEAHRRCLEFLVESLEATGAEVSVQSFADPGFPLEGVDSLHNVRAWFGPSADAAPYLILGAHWDSRPWADEDEDPAYHDRPVPGANDGASGVAVLLELARSFQVLPPPVGVEIVLFDGEDAGDSQDQETYCRGSQGFVARIGHPRPIHVVILDMVGRVDMAIYKEGNSIRAATNLVDRIWDGAAKVKATSFHGSERHYVYDDHVPFMQAGIPAVDVIDLDDPHWHTHQDVPGNCSPASLLQVGNTMLWHIYTLELELP